MPKPHLNVLLSFAEAYLKERQVDWGLETLPNGNLKLPVNDKWKEDKIDSLNTILHHLVQAAPEPGDSEKWISLAYEIYLEELKESARNGYTAYNRLLEDLIRGMRSYIVNGIKEEDAFKNKIEALKDTMMTQEKSILVLINPEFAANHAPNELVQARSELEVTKKQIASLTAAPKVLNKYFDQLSLLKDKPLSLEEFINSAINGERPAKLCTQLMVTKPINMLPANNNNAPAVITTAPAAVAQATVNVTANADKKPEEVKPEKKAAEGSAPSALVKNSLLAPAAKPKSARQQKNAPGAPRKPRGGHAKPAPVPLQFSSDSDNSPDKDLNSDVMPMPASGRSLRSGKTYQ